MEADMASQIFLGLLIAAMAPGNDPATPPSLHGTWRVVYANNSGKVAPVEALTDFRVIISDDQMTIDKGDGVREVVKIRTDPKQTPATFDAVPPMGRPSRPGIFEIDGERLKLCWATEGARPPSFEAAAGSKRMLLVLQRVQR
jgi:uncharacterized protein (TIGR03067 family)